MTNLNFCQTKVEKKKIVAYFSLKLVAIFLNIKLKRNVGSKLKLEMSLGNCSTDQKEQDKPKQEIL